jgi:hypothetical protein
MGAVGEHDADRTTGRNGGPALAGPVSIWANWADSDNRPDCFPVMFVFGSFKIIRTKNIYN